MDRPLIVGMGGTTRENSSTEMALELGLARARALGAETECFAGEALDLPHYGSARANGDVRALRLIDALRRCDGVILSSPGYHGSMSGMLKNALDYVEELRDDERPYLDGRAVGVIVGAHGAQAIGTTLVAVRSVIHALRAWPTPLGVGINSTTPAFDGAGRCLNPALAETIATMVGQVVDFARMRRAAEDVECTVARAARV